MLEHNRWSAVSQKGFSFIGAVLDKKKLTHYLQVEIGEANYSSSCALISSGCAFRVNGISWCTRVDSSLQALERVFLCAAKVGAWCVLPVQMQLWRHKLASSSRGGALRNSDAHALLLYTTPSCAV